MSDINHFKPRIYLSQIGTDQHTVDLPTGLSMGSCHKEFRMKASHVRRTVWGAGCLAMAVLSTSALAQATFSKDEARKLIEPFYSMLNQPATKDLKALSEQVLAPEWKSYVNEVAFKGREGFVAQVGGFGKIVPDLKWDIKDVLVDDNRIVVRSEASGTPVAAFLGVPPSGKSFKIMTIDIHTIINGKAVLAHHVEDWAMALRQLAAQ
jgi:predicted ester cyclase